VLKKENKRTFIYFMVSPAERKLLS